jgi:hypothetical protein
VIRETTATALILDLPGQPQGHQGNVGRLEATDGTQLVAAFCGRAYCMDLIGGPYTTPMPQCARRSGLFHAAGRKLPIDNNMNGRDPPTAFNDTAPNPTAAVIFIHTALWDTGHGWLEIPRLPAFSDLGAIRVPACEPHARRHDE